MLGRRRALLHRYDSRHHHALGDTAAAKAFLAEQGVPVVEALGVCRSLLDIEAAVERARGESDLVIRTASGELRLGLGTWEAGGWRGAGGFVSDGALGMMLARVLFQAQTAGLDEHVSIERRVNPPAARGTPWASGIELRVVALEGKAAAMAVRHPERVAASAEAKPKRLEVEIDTGRVLEPAVNDGELATPLAIAGATVPHFGDLVGVALRAAGHLPIELIGVDVAMDRQRGALVVGLDALAALHW